MEPQNRVFVLIRLRCHEMPYSTAVLLNESRHKSMALIEEMYAADSFCTAMKTRLTALVFISVVDGIMRLGGDVTCNYADTPAARGMLEGHSVRGIFCTSLNCCAV